MGRAEDLLEQAAAWLDDGRVPLTHEFLVEHNVTIYEAFDLAEHLAMGARMYVNVREELGEGGLVGTVAAHRLVAALPTIRERSKRKQ